MTLYDSFVRSVVDFPPDLTWHGPDVATLPAVEPDSANVAWIDQPYEEVEFVDCEAVADIALNTLEDLEAENRPLSRYEEDRERHQAEKEAAAEAQAEARAEARAEERAERRASV